MRCAWAETNDDERNYHDTEWGVPLRNDQRLFEMICLEGAQAGLSWDMILKKRDNYRRIFHDFNIQKCANLSDDEIAAALLDSGIIRNKLKVNGVRTNARAALEIIKTHGSLANYIWSFVNNQPIDGKIKQMSDTPATTELSDRMSKQMKKDGFKFVGGTICYAFMQAIGMVNDHQMDCDQYRKVKEQK